MTLIWHDVCFRPFVRSLLIFLINDIATEKAANKAIKITGLFPLLSSSLLHTTDFFPLRLNYSRCILLQFTVSARLLTALQVTLYSLFRRALGRNVLEGCLACCHQVNVEDEQLCHEYQYCQVHHGKGPDDPNKRLRVRFVINAGDILVENGEAIEV